MYGIAEQVYSRLMSYFEHNEAIKQVTLFGSRAKGLARLNADIDLYIEYTGPHKGTVVLELEDCAGIYSLDIVFAGAINEELANQIQRDGIVIYKL